MRIASTQYSASMNEALQLASTRLEDIMQQMSSGKRILRPSDDPVSSVRLSRMEREDAALTQYRDNIGALKSRLQQNEALLSGMTKDMQQARDLLVWAADGGNTSADVNAMSSSLQSLRDSLLYSANSKDQEGRYLFSGTLVTTATISYDPTQPVGSRYSFTGNTDQQMVVVGNGVTKAANLSLDEVAGLLNRLDGTVATLQTPGVDVSNAVTHADIAGSLDLLDTVFNSVTGKIADLGGRQNTLSALDTNHENVSLSNQQAALTLGQLDYGKAAVELSGYTTAVQATQKAYGRVSQLSLFNVL
ncbi:flagellar hook-associated protein FlgL [Jeongeupia naejangsanensis]|uniref:Flagellar hook-associated protein FlgL n=1 Tax=Jeongeupia naejangsanensis TaxID=613195 RepID=A0ABS2BIQ7_9NEIS|nr:flagellar hook-associated protein FlgL [Jeongeupia naejangsanensis]MBM3114694.1 flagellar hook-associated protein FlgL [Jeongeupia naejangsanensis]